MDTEPGAYKLDPPQGEALWFFGGLATVKASSEQTGGRLSITEQLFPMGMATPLHSQPEDDETFYVLEGDLTFYLEDGLPLAAPAGSFVHLPAGTVHAYQVDSETARVLNITPPNTRASSARRASRRRRAPCLRRPRPTWTSSWPRQTNTGSRYSVPRPVLRARTGSNLLYSPPPRGSSVLGTLG